MADGYFNDPAVAPFFACPNCERLLAFDVTQCPHCCELIDDDQKVYATAVNVLTTQAVSLANTITSGDVGVLIFLGIGAYAVIGGFGVLMGVSIFNTALVVAAIIRWFQRYGRLPLPDPDFAIARREMKRSLRMWLALGLLQTIVTLIWWPSL